MLRVFALEGTDFPYGLDYAGISINFLTQGT